MAWAASRRARHSPAVSWYVSFAAAMTSASNLCAGQYVRLAVAHWRAIGAFTCCYAVFTLLIDPQVSGASTIWDGSPKSKPPWLCQVRLLSVFSGNKGFAGRVAMAQRPAIRLMPFIFGIKRIQPTARSAGMPMSIRKHAHSGHSTLHSTPCAHISRSMVRTQGSQPTNDELASPSALLCNPLPCALNARRSGASPIPYAATSRLRSIARLAPIISTTPATYSATLPGPPPREARHHRSS